MNKIRLELVGITYNQIESGVYAVILKEAEGNLRIPIIIGFPEAQAIECKLQEVVTPRPLTHDLMVNVMESHGIHLEEVTIYKLPSGVFAAELLMTDGKETRVIDSRSSDAIALAIRTGAPIYTTREVLDESGFEPGANDRRSAIGRQQIAKPEKRPVENDLSAKDLKTLKAEMQQAAESENYELAARIKAEIDRRENKNENL